MCSVLRDYEYSDCCVPGSYHTRSTNPDKNVRAVQPVLTCSSRVVSARLQGGNCHLCPPYDMYGAVEGSCVFEHEERTYMRSAVRPYDCIMSDVSKRTFVCSGQTECLRVNNCEKLKGYLHTGVAGNAASALHCPWRSSDALAPNCCCGTYLPGMAHDGPLGNIKSNRRDKINVVRVQQTESVTKRKCNRKLY